MQGEKKDDETKTDIRRHGHEMTRPGEAHGQGGHQNDNHRVAPVAKKLFDQFRVTNFAHWVSLRGKSKASPRRGDRLVTELSLFAHGGVG